MSGAKLVRTYDHFIDGAWTAPAGGGYLQTTNPYSGQVSARFAGCRVPSARKIPAADEIAAYVSSSRTARSSFCGRRMSLSRIGTPLRIE